MTLNMRLSRFITLICAIIFSTSALFAQSQGDKLYNQGLQAQKTMTIASQNNAINKFISAKKIYDSAAKKAQCDQAIAVSRNIIASLKDGSGDNGSSKKKGKNNNKNTSKQEQTPRREEARPSLELTNSEFNIDLSARTLSVGVKTNQPEWKVSVIPCDDGTSFLNAEKKGDNVEIRIASNSTTFVRTQKINVTAGDLSRNIVITQTGRRIDLDASDKLLKFKEKGGQKKLSVSCNADQKYSENADENWYIERIPKWVKIVIGEKQEKSGGLLNVIKKDKNKDPNMVKTGIILTCDHLVPGSPEAYTGRKGEVVLRSGDKTVTIYIHQVGKGTFVE